MEYRVYKKIRHYLKIHIFVRYFIGAILVLLALIPIIIPFPWSAIIGILMIVLALLTVVPGKKVRHVIKIRKGFLYLMKNLNSKVIIRHKMRDFSLHIKEILDDKKEKKSHKIRETFSRFKVKRVKNIHK